MLLAVDKDGLLQWHEVTIGGDIVVRATRALGGLPDLGSDLSRPVLPAARRG